MSFDVDIETSKTISAKGVSAALQYNDCGLICADTRPYYVLK